MARCRGSTASLRSRPFGATLHVVGPDRERLAAALDGFRDGARA